jgi:hypothetical protein
VHAVERRIIGVPRVSIVSIGISIGVVGSIGVYAFLLAEVSW